MHTEPTDDYDRRIGPCRNGDYWGHEDPDNTGMCFKCSKILQPEDDEDDEHNRTIDKRLGLR